MPWTALLECPWARFRIPTSSREAVRQPRLTSDIPVGASNRKWFLGGFSWAPKQSGEMLWTIRIPNISNTERGSSRSCSCQSKKLWMRWDRWNSIDFTYTRPAGCAGVLCANRKFNHSFISCKKTHSTTPHGTYTRLRLIKCSMWICIFSIHKRKKLLFIGPQDFASPPLRVTQALGSKHSSIGELCVTLTYTWPKWRIN